MLPPIAITLRAMRFHAIVGILPHERELPQPLEVDVTAVVAADAVPRLDYRTLYAATAQAQGGGAAGVAFLVAAGLLLLAAIVTAVAVGPIGRREPACSRRNGPPEGGVKGLDG